MAAPEIPPPFFGAVRSLPATLRAWGDDFRISLASAFVGRRHRVFMGGGKLWAGNRYGFNTLTGEWWLSGAGQPIHTMEGQGFLSFARSLYGTDEGEVAVALLGAMDGVAFDEPAKDAIAAAVNAMVARRVAEEAVSS